MNGQDLTAGNVPEAALDARALETRSPDITIRRLEPDEWRVLRGVRLRALADSPDAFGSTLARETGRDEAAWRSWLVDRERVVVVAERGGTVVGMASGGRAPVEDRVAGLYAMWVEPAVRGTGAAPALVYAIETWARGAGYREIGLGVTVGNDRATAFYERLGYRDTGGRRPLRDGSALEIRIMAKELEG